MTPSSQICCVVVLEKQLLSSISSVEDLAAFVSLNSSVCRTSDFTPGLSRLVPRSPPLFRVWPPMLLGKSSFCVQISQSHRPGLDTMSPERLQVMTLNTLYICLFILQDSAITAIYPHQAQRPSEAPRRNLAQLPLGRGRRALRQRRGCRCQRGCPFCAPGVYGPTEIRLGNVSLSSHRFIFPTHPSLTA
jgi:hypothetical protein